MTYRYRPPVIQSEPGTEETPSTQTETEPSEFVFRRATVLGRYADLFRELTRAFDRAPLGLWPRIQELAPAVARSIDDSDRDAEDLAVAYVAGLVQVDELERALRVHRDAWVRGAEIVIRATTQFPARESCIQCGDTRMTTAVRDDEGKLRCRRCLDGAGGMAGES